ncbi:MAG TPA: FmdB family zinc ribbon protein [Candidatus Limnocylindrales bacterium]|nr:FmdB family zinc ribbon protein [Candidatus Limnocylindrales bacterium]
MKRVSMPTYEYVCTSCDTPLEVVQSIHEPSLTDCPSCADGRLRKVFGNVGVVFKGSGFYRTDSRGKSSATSPATPKPESKKSADAGGPSSTGGSSSTGGGSGSSGSTSGASASKSATPAAS